MTDTECCENVWKDFYKCEYSQRICKESEKLFVVYDNGSDYVNCYIGIPANNYPYTIEIPETEWACFKLTGIDDEYVNKFYKDILNQWFLSSGYSKNNDVPNVEVFPSDMSEDLFDWEIWIPIKKGN